MLALDVDAARLAGRHGRAISTAARPAQARLILRRDGERRFGRARRRPRRPAAARRQRAGARGAARAGAPRLSRVRPRSLSRGAPDAGLFRLRAEGLRRARAARRAGRRTRRRRAPQPAEPRPIEPDEKEVTGFVFKVQANMDPNHRDRIAFMRLCSGRFRRGMKLKHLRTGKPIAVHSADPVLRPGPRARRRGVARRHHRHPQSRHAARRRHADRGIERSASPACPNFAPEILRRVRLGDPTKPSSCARRSTTWPRKA